MYGTIARIHPKPGRETELRALMERYESGGRRPPGYRQSFVFRPDKDPYDRPTLFLIALFDDAETYRANADSPEQDVEYRAMLELLEDEPDWMDGTFEGV
jgi:antibiotic biosynthesis monooxygenase (ABM) superfamily enzyme